MQILLWIILKNLPNLVQRYFIYLKGELNVIVTRIIQVSSEIHCGW